MEGLRAKEQKEERIISQSDTIGQNTKVLMKPFADKHLQEIGHNIKKGEATKK